MHAETRFDPSVPLATATVQDLLHVHQVTKLATPVASIGGAGTFDGVFLTGILAVLLA
jgi:uncharacterized membrane protein